MSVARLLSSSKCQTLLDDNQYASRSSRESILDLRVVEKTSKTRMGEQRWKAQDLPSR